LSQFQRLKFFDCSNNNLSEIDGSDFLLELSIQNNKITKLPQLPELTILMIDDNLLTSLMTYPSLKILNASRNKLINVESQPQLTKIVASHNLISKIGSMPNLEIIELDNNKIETFEIFDVSKHVCIQFNPLNNLSVNKSAFQNMEELQVDFKLYENIYAKCYDDIKSVNMGVCENKINEINKKLEGVFNARTLKYIKKKFMSTKFQDRTDMFTNITLRIRDEYFEMDDEEMLREKCVTTLKNISKLYHKAVIVSLVFNL
jgi:Leucine-rich repeat (LRR) protein